MRPLVTILYEDSIRRDADGSYPLHDFVVRLVEEATESSIPIWVLHKQISAVPRNGVGEVLKDVAKRAALLAGAGELFLLLDRDRIAHHLNLDGTASEARIVEAVRAKAAMKVREKLKVFFLQRNVEGLIRSIRECDCKLVSDDVFDGAIEKKKLNSRDQIFAAAKGASWGGRPCVRSKQPGLDALVQAIAAEVQVRGILH